MPTDRKETLEQSEPREIRVGRLNRKPGPNKAIISLAVVIILVALFIYVFLSNGF